MNSITLARTFGAFHSVMTQWSGSSQRRAPLALLQAIRATIPPASPHLSFSFELPTPMECLLRQPSPASFQACRGNGPILTLFTYPLQAPAQISQAPSIRLLRSRLRLTPQSY